MKRIHISAAEFEINFPPSCNGNTFTVCQTLTVHLWQTVDFIQRKQNLLAAYRCTPRRCTAGVLIHASIFSETRRDRYKRKSTGRANSARGKQADFIVPPNFNFTSKAGSNGSEPSIKHRTNDKSINDVELQLTIREKIVACARQ